MERLTIGLQDLQVKQGDDGDEDAMTFSGYGAVFGNVDSYGDVIKPGAFKASLSAARNDPGRWPAMLLQHGGFGLDADSMMPIGAWTSMAEDDVGLKVEGMLAPTQRGREAYALMKMKPRPAITGLSIGYVAKEFTPASRPEEPRRTIKKIDLFEVSLVTFPANARARVASVKSIDDILVLSDAEAFLREAGGFSRSQAVGLIARIKAAASAPNREGEPAGTDANDDDAAHELKAALERLRSRIAT